MELREKIAEFLCSMQRPDEISRWKKASQIYKSYWLKSADQILAIIHGEWLDKPNEEGWWWDSNLDSYYINDGTIAHWEGSCFCEPISKHLGKWCKAIVPEIGESEMEGFSVTDFIDQKCAKAYFKGQEAGRKEVVEWINRHTVGITTDNQLKDNLRWRAQLRDWGIGE